MDNRTATAIAQDDRDQATLAALEDAHPLVRDLVDDLVVEVEALREQLDLARALTSTLENTLAGAFSVA